MGLNRKGLGAALTTLGGVLESNRLQKEEQRRREEVEAKEERRLQLQEKDAEQRREMNRIKINMDRAKWNNQQIMQAGAGSDFDPAVMGRAYTQFGADGLVWTFNPSKSVKNEGGTYDKIVYDMGTYETKGGGVGGVGGTPTIKSLGGAEKVFQTGPNKQGNVVSATGWLTSHTSWMANPNNLFARHEEAITGEIQQQRMEQAQKSKLAISEASAQGQRKAKQDVAETKLTEARAAALEAESTAGPKGKKGGSEVTGFDDKPVKIDKETAQSLRTAMPIVSKKYSDVTSPTDVWKIDQVKNNKKVRDSMNENIRKVLAGELSDAELVQGSREELGLSGEFVQDLIDTARANQEAWEADLESKSPNLLQKTVNKIIGTKFGTGK